MTSYFYDKRLKLKTLNFALVGALLLCFNTLNAQITGDVFRDYNGNGTKQANEPFVSDIQVNAYSSTDVLCGTATTSGNSSPNYSLTGCGSNDVRVEFIIPAGNFSADSGVDFSALSGVTYGSAVRFVTGSTSNVNFALHYGGDYNSGTTNAELFIPKMNINDPTGGGGGSSPGAQTGFFGFDYSNTGTTTPNKSVKSDTIGTTFGVAYSAQANVVFTAAFLKRHAGLGRLGSGGIYMLTPSSTSFDVSEFYNMDANGYRTRAGSGAPAYGSGTSYSISGNTVTYLGSTDAVSGSPVGLGVIGTNSGRGLATDLTSDANDPAAFDQVGKVGLGGIEVSDDGKYLYVVNLYSRSVYRLTLDDAYNPTSVTAVNEYALPSVTVTNGVLRPFGIKYQRGSLFVGAVATGENSGSNTVGGSTDMYGYVFELEDAKGSASFNSTAVVSYPLNYRKGEPVPWSGSSLGNEWEAWTNNSGAVFIVSGDEGTYPTPILSDIDFSERGDMIMSFMDRSGHQWGWLNNRHVSGTTSVRYAVGGDILIAGKNTGTGAYAIENNGSITSVNGQSINSGTSNNQGPGNSEFFKGETYGTNHEETSMGSVALLKGTNEMIAVVMDPNRIWSGGTEKLSTSTGAGIASTDYELYYTASGSQATFGKANGLGEIEILTEESPVEVGNRVWFDEDEDGIQDAGEPGIADVSLELCDLGTDGIAGTADDGLIASVVTDVNGNYYFTTASGTSATGITYNCAISYDSTYFVKIATGDWDTSDGSGINELSGYYLTLTGESGNGKAGMSDNDGVLTSSKAIGATFTITEIGGNNHDIDFGFKLSNIRIGNYVWLDKNGDGIQSVGEKPLSNVVLCLYDNAGNPVYDSVTVVTCLNDDVSTDFSSNSVSDNDGSINFNGSWVLSIIGSGSVNLSAYDEIVNNELSISGLNGVATRNITPPAYSIDTVVVSFRLKQVGFDSGDNGIAEYYNGSTWVNLGTYTDTELPSSGTYYDFSYTSTSISGLLDIEGIRFSEGSWASSNEGFYIDDLQIEFKSACTTTVTAGDAVKDTTDANGYYEFSTVDHGIKHTTVYEIRIPTNQDTIANLSVSGTGSGTSDNDNNGTLSGSYVTTGSITSPTPVQEVDTSFDFGFIGYSLGNSVWWDNNDDGNMDASEIGIAGVTVYLLDNTGAAIDSTTTGSSGNYMFYGLLPGDYQVAVMSPLTSGILDGGAVSSVTTTTADTDLNNDGSAIDPIGNTVLTFTSISTTITLGNQAEPTTESDEDANTDYPDNQSNLGVDFGFPPPTTAVGNFVFWDKNNDGDFDASDDSLANIKVYLYQDMDGNGTAETLIDSVFTDINGSYSFDSLGAGAFQITIAGDNFNVGGPLATGNATTNVNSQDTSTDNNSEGISSSVFSLSPNTQNLADANDGSSTVYDDDDANFTFDFGFYGNAGGPVPVTWLGKLQAQKDEDVNAKLNWATASELNNKHFVIERSFDGQQFEIIGYTPSKGNLLSVQHYTYLDRQVPSNVVFYRVAQEDFDGSLMYTNVVSLVFKSNQKLLFYPNPTMGIIHFEINNVAISQVKLLGIEGKVVAEFNWNEGDKQLNLGDIPSGVYYLNIAGPEFNKTSKIVITK